MTRTRTAILATALALPLAACSSDSAPDEQEAAVMCEQFLQQRIADDAEISGPMDTEITERSADPWQYDVAGAVTSSVRSGTYACTISTTDGETWTLDDLQVTDN